MHAIVCVFDNVLCIDLISAVILDRSWQNSTNKHNMPEIRSASGTEIIISGKITLFLRIGKSRTWVTFVVIDKFAVLLLLWSTSVEWYINSVYPAEK